MIDPREGKQRIDYYGLDDKGSYQAIIEDARGKFHSRVIPGFWLRKEWLWQDRFPDPLRTLMEIAPDAVRNALSKED